MNYRHVALLALSPALLGPPATAQPRWVVRDAPPRVYNAAAAYDAQRQRVVVFGGVEGPAGALTGDTWEWDGGGWARRLPAVAPCARRAHAMAYDPVGCRVLLFGGADANGNALGDTWTWDGHAWTQLAPAAAPTAQGGHAMATDTLRGRIVLLGSSIRGGETWEWDGTSWQQRTPLNPPPQRANHVMAYDAARGRVVMFGGAHLWTWEWDGNDWTRFVTNPRPISRQLSAMVYNPVRGRVALFGGRLFGSPPLANDLWEWDGTQWTELMPTGAPGAPSAREAHVMVYDLARGEAVMTGGGLRDTWAWSGASWQQKGVSMPDDRARHAMAFDTARGRVLLFGGTTHPTGSAGTQMVDDTWEWDGTRWTDRGAGGGPVAREGHGLAFAPQRGVAVLFGGQDSMFQELGDTWEWDGTTWTAPAVAAGPPPRREHVLVHDPIRARTVLFGGFSVAGLLGDTWEWNGVQWTARPGPAPSARWGHAAVFDPTRQRIVLFGGVGGGCLADTWEWDGTGWLQRFPATVPPARDGHAMVYAAARRRVVMLGGYDGRGGLRSDTWEWDGNDWTAVTTPRAPTGRIGHAMACDPLRDRVVLFGGEERTRFFGKTWLFGDTEAAAVAAAGTGCGSGGAAPILGAFGRPTLHNQRFALDLTGAPPSSAGAFVLSLGGGALPLGNGCTLWMDPTQVFASWLAVTTSTGFAGVRVPIGGLPQYIGLDLHAQAAVVDAGGPFLGLSLSGGLQLTLGE